MISRRRILIGSAATAAAVLVRRATPVFATASQPAAPINFAVPPGACDCHTHIYGDIAAFPMSPARAYTPEPATVEELHALHRALHIDRVVIVTPSPYGTDNACTMDAVKRIGPKARCVVVIDDKTPDASLDAMNKGGARGVRLNLITGVKTDVETARHLFQMAVARTEPRHWHVQLYARLETIDALKDQIAASPVPVVFDHFGDAQAPLGVAQSGFKTMLDLVQSGHAYVKISAPYRSSKLAPDYPDVAPLAKALIAANPQRMIWGSDWPHPNPALATPTGLTPFWKIEDGSILNQLPVWAPEAAVRKTILVDNPARLYGF
jgi:predicted TIM-barrel fold metal-dependent hydrolase